ncbi:MULTISPECIES: fumarylacetoacetate hydrolase family protein [unclassified Paenibacillus]|uniref:fumarylacetoacetate hydrolase family protein n=1 Tax=unclassified Paenibacillus TaxID=185978 RepID=UPI00362BA5A3
MKFARYQEKQTGLIKSAVLREETLYEIEGDLFNGWTYTGPSNQLNNVTLLSPLEPRSVIGVGSNYIVQGGVKPEQPPQIPVFFYKSLSSVIGSEEPIVIPAGIEEVKFESELAVIIGKTARHISEQDALDYVFGYTIANDVTASQFFHPNGHWMVGKSFDTFTPLGPYIETELQLDSIRVQAVHNGVMKQDSGLDLIILNIPFLISYLSRVMTLQPGDVILSGSPSGADFMKKGDEISCIIEEIGVLRNPVITA